MAGEPDARVAHGLQRLAKTGGSPLGRSGRIIELVRQTRGELAERQQLVALSLKAGGLTDPVGHHRHQALAQQRHALHHLGKITPVQTRDARRTHGNACPGEMGQP